jgi:iron complex outermembrane receptor protein
MLLSPISLAEELDEDLGDELADFYGDEEFVSIATGTKQQVNKAPAVATVITSSQIIAMGARNLTEVLDTVPGLHASRSGQLLAPEYWFRGITSTFNPHTLMMINGVSTKSVVRGDNHIVWGEFPIHSIERIEIIRGPGSALYGADAFSGVINIITKKNSSTTASNEIGGMVGSFGTQNIWSNNVFSYKGWKFATNFEYLVSDGYEGIINSDAQTNIDAFGATIGAPPVSLAPGRLSTQFKAFDVWFSGENDHMSFDIGLLNKFDVGSGLGATEVLDSNGQEKGYKNILSFSSKPIQLSDAFSITTQLSYYASSQEIEKDFLLFPEGSFFGAFPDGFIGNPGWQEETTKAEIDLKYSGFKSTNLLFGLGYERQNLYEVTESKNFLADLTPRPGGLEDVSDTSEVYLAEADRESNFLYLQSVSQLAPDWELTFGGRYDDYSDFGSSFNPRAALVWSTTQKITTKFLYGKAFRAPSFAELLTVNNPIALGNLSLSPETIDTYEVAFNYKNSAEFSMDINLFNYKIEDFITFVGDSNGQTATAQNVGQRTGRGLEASVSYSMKNNLKLIANTAYVKATDDLLNDDVGEYPNLQSYFRLEWNVNDNWNLNSQVSIIGSRERVPDDVRKKLDGNITAFVSTSYKFNESNTNLELLVSNLFDEDVREPSSSNQTFGQTNIPNDLPQQGRAIYLRLSTRY